MAKFAYYSINGSVVMDEGKTWRVYVKDDVDRFCQICSEVYEENGWPFDMPTHVICEIAHGVPEEELRRRFYVEGLKKKTLG